MHWLAPVKLWYDPAAQAAQVPWPVEGWALPVLHTVHNVLEVAPASVSVDFPAAHASHALLPAVAAMLPDRHVWQTVVPDED